MATDKLLEELRWAKERQWVVAIATIAFIAGAFHMAHTVKPPLVACEKLMATILVSIVAVGGSAFLFSLQSHLSATRKIVDPTDPNPWWRGADIVIGLATVLII